MIAKSVFAVLPLIGLARAHASIWHPSMYGFNVTATNSPQYGDRDNRPQAPLRQLPFDQWWFHGHLDQPPHPEDVMELPAGGKVTTELACDKDATSYWPSGPGGDQQSGNDPCPPGKLIHTNGIDDLGGCALAIAYKSDATQVQPEDFVVFSVNHRCVWDRFTDFYVPANMPECPNGKCTCAWFWQHREDAGGDEMYMNGFQCKVTGATATTPIPQGQVPTDCRDDSSKCVKGAKQPFYWDQAERNNVFFDIYSPALYLETHGFKDGAQNDIWDTVGGSSGGASKSVDSSSSTSTSVAASTPAAAPTSAADASTSAAVTTSSSSQAPEATPAPTQQPETPAANSSSDAPATSTPAAQAQAVDPTTPVSNQTPTSTSTPTNTASLTQGGQGHRTCRAKKHKRSARRHRRSRAL